MKKLLTASIFLLVWGIFGSISYSLDLSPVSDFSDWSGELYLGDTASTFNPSLITPNGSSVDINIAGDSEYVWTGLYQTGSPGTIGMLATITISNSNGVAQAGITDGIGKVGNDRIQAYMYLEESNGQKRIRYRLRLKDLTNREDTQQLTSGCIGEWDGAWNSGDNITVGFMRTGNDFWFYAEGYPGFVKWTHTGGTVEDLTWSPEVFGYTDPGTENTITANISNVYILSGTYP